MSQKDTNHMSYRCGPATEPLLYETISEAFDRTVARYPDNAGLVVTHQDICWTYTEYQTEINKLATGLLAIGVKPGDRVGIWSPNRYEWCLTQFATAKIGAIMVCVNPAYREYELEYALNKVQCSTLITAEQFKTSHYLNILTGLAEEMNDCNPGELNAIRLPALKRVIRMGDEATPGMFNFSEVCNMGDDYHYDEMTTIASSLNPDDAINIQFTSGTTGNPKGATLSHCNILNNGKVVGEGMNLTAKDKLCIPVPLYHCFGMVMGNLACITHGSTAVFPGEGFDPGETLHAIEKEQCTALHGVPTMFIAEMDHPDFEKFDLGSLRTGIMAGSPCPVEVMNKVIEKMHMGEVLIAYGQTETSPVNHMTHANDPIEKRVGTVGMPGPHLEIKIVDEKNQVVPTGEKGEICARGYAVMKCYWDDEEKSREIIDEGGWLHSGDLGIMDEEGYVQVVGRIKDMIIRGGENVYPREIEEFLYTHPAIQDVQVIGVADVKYGEQVCAWIMLKQGQSATEEDIKSFCKDKIAHFKVPHYIKFVDAFPMTVTGKIQKFLMREQMEKELQ